MKQNIMNEENKINFCKASIYNVHFDILMMRMTLYVYDCVKQDEKHFSKIEFINLKEVEFDFLAYIQVPLMIVDLHSFDWIIKDGIYVITIKTAEHEITIKCENINFEKDNVGKGGGEGWRNDEGEPVYSRRFVKLPVAGSVHINSITTLVNKIRKKFNRNG